MTKEIKKKITKKEAPKDATVENNVVTEVKEVEDLEVKDSQTEDLEAKEPQTEDSKKTLGKSSYKNSKQKKKLQKQKLIETKKIIDKDRQLKVKIKHLEKELVRISKAIESGKTDKKNSDEKATIEKKLAKLEVEKKKIVKH